MKDKLLQIRVDEEFTTKLESLRNTNGCSNFSETIRRIVDEAIENQDRKNADCNRCIHKEVCFDFWQSNIVTCDDERNIDCMNESWSCNCNHYNLKR